MILNNPLIRRYRYSMMRPRQLWVYATIYVGVVVLIIFVDYVAVTFPGLSSRPETFFKHACNHIFFMQVILLCVIGFYNSGSAIRQEIVGKSYDFFRLLPLSAGKKLVGILFGKNLLVLTFAALNFLLIVGFGPPGRLRASPIIQKSFTLVSIAILLNCFALLSAINPASKKTKSSIAPLVVMVIFIGPILLRPLDITWSLDEPEIATGKFYVFELPRTVLVGLVALYFSAWSVAGILRRFNREDEPLFSRFAACLFMFGCEFVLLGLFYRYLTEGTKAPWFVNYTYWSVSLLPMVIVPFWSLRTYDEYLERAGLSQGGPEAANSLMPAMLIRSNIFLCLCLFAIWACGILAAAMMAGLSITHHLFMIWVAFSFCLFVFLLIEISVVCKPFSSKIGLLSGFIAVVYIILPLMLAGLLRNEKVMLYSPVGFIIGLFRSSPSEAQVSIPDSVWILNLMLCIVPATLVWNRYHHILTTRRNM